MIALERSGAHPDDVVEGMRATAFVDGVDGGGATRERPATVREVRVRDAFGFRFVDRVVVELEDETARRFATVVLAVDGKTLEPKTYLGENENVPPDTYEIKHELVEERRRLAFRAGIRFRISPELRNDPKRDERRLAISFMFAGMRHYVGSDFWEDVATGFWPNLETRNTVRHRLGLVGTGAFRNMSDEELDAWLLRERVRAVELGEVTLEVPQLEGLDTSARQAAKVLGFGARWGGLDGTRPLTVRERADLIRLWESATRDHDYGRALEIERLMRDDLTPTLPPAVAYRIRFGSWPEIHEPGSDPVAA